MKKTLTLIALAFVFCTFGHAQKTVKNPQTGFSNATGLKIKQIDTSPTATTLRLRYEGESESIAIPSKTALQSADGKTRLFVNRTEGIPLDSFVTVPKGGIDFSVVFPALPAGLTQFDYVELETQSPWMILDIALVPRVWRVIPETLSGNWFDQATGNYTLSLYDSTAVYRSRLWSYGDGASLKKRRGYIALRNGADVERLYIDGTRDSLLLVGTSPADARPLTRTANVFHGTDAPYEATNFFRRDTATFCGYIHGYSPRMVVGKLDGVLDIQVCDFMEDGRPDDYAVKIAPNGFFSIKIPTISPCTGYTRLTENVYLEPGKTLFVNIDLKEQKLLCMGSATRLNIEMMTNLPERALSGYDEIAQTALACSPADYKAHCEAYKDSIDQQINTWESTGSFGAKTLQVMRALNGCAFAKTMLDYAFQHESDYRDKNKNDHNPMPPIEMPADYYNFLTQNVVDNPVYTLSRDYFIFTNRLQYSNEVRGNMDYNNRSEQVKTFRRWNYPFTEDEYALIDKDIVVDSIRKNDPVCVHSAEIDNVFSESFLKNHKEQVDEWQKEGIASKYNYDFEKFLKAKEVKLTKEEKKLITEAKKLWKSKAGKRVRNNTPTYNSEERTADSLLWIKINAASGMTLIKMNIDAREANLKKEFGITAPNFATDVMLMEECYHLIGRNLKPFSDIDINAMQQHLATPFFRDYLTYLNTTRLTQMKYYQEHIKHDENPMSDVQVEQMFDSIMTKYRGKIVLVDVWETWCGPCLKAISKVAPLKEELKDNPNIVFVYLASESSPMEKYNKLLPNIAGEHYRLSKEQYAGLMRRFNISGIPHYILVGKDGAVIEANFDGRRPDLKEVLLKYAE